MIIETKVEVHNSDIVINDLVTHVSTASFTFMALGRRHNGISAEVRAVNDLFTRLNKFLPAVSLYNDLPDEDKTSKLVDTSMNNEVVRLLHRNISNEIIVPFVIYDSGAMVDTGRKRKKCNKYIKIMCKIIREENDA